MVRLRGVNEEEAQYEPEVRAWQLDTGRTRFRRGSNWCEAVAVLQLLRVLQLLLLCLDGPLPRCSNARFFPVTLWADHTHLAGPRGGQPRLPMLVAQMVFEAHTTWARLFTRLVHPRGTGDVRDHGGVRRGAV